MPISSSYRTGAQDEQFQVAWAIDGDERVCGSVWMKELGEGLCEEEAMQGGSLDVFGNTHLFFFEAREACTLLQCDHECAGKASNTMTMSDRGQGSTADLGTGAWHI